MARLFSGGPLLDRQSPTMVESSSPSRSPISSDFAGEETPAPPKSPLTMNPLVFVGVVPSPGHVSETPLKEIDDQDVLCVVPETLLKNNQSNPEPGELAPVCSVKEVCGKDLVNLSSMHSPPAKGTWAKKLNFSVASASQQAPCNSRIASQMWPPLCLSNKNRSHHGRGLQIIQKPIQNSAVMEDDFRFSWAIKMNPASRNLYRAMSQNI